MNVIVCYSTNASISKTMSFNKTFNKFGVGSVVNKMSGLNVMISLVSPNIEKKVFFIQANNIILLQYIAIIFFL